MTAVAAPTDLRSRFVGLDIEVPVLDGSRVAYINFDNAASTPPFRQVREGMDRFLEVYASVHRGTGFKSRLSTWAYEQARERTLGFVGADPAKHTCIFGKNTTEAINKLARRLSLAPGDVVLTTEMEHHSNDLPFRAAAEVVHVGLLVDGRLDEADFDSQLNRFAGRVRLVAVTGASNVTGYLNPVARLARKAHAAGAMILVDCAQLAPHRAVTMGTLDDPAHLDFVALSAHKLYAPLGTGALIGRRDVFERGDPDMRGGGTVEIVTLDDVVWSDPPDKDEAGSPNVVGAVAMGIAMNELEVIGMDVVAAHEAELTGRVLGGLGRIDRVHVFGDAEPERASERLGVIPFQVEGISHFLVAAILGYEFGIGVRSGCFCAHPYVLRLLGLDQAQTAFERGSILEGDRSHMPGLVRASIGLYNTADEVDRFLEAIRSIASRRGSQGYRQDRASGEYHPTDWSPDFREYFPYL